jgi:hypothetical protein
MFEFAGVWIGIIGGSLGLALVAGAEWWKLWMMYGWPGAPGFLAKLLGAQGDRFYDAMQDELTIWCFGFLLTLAVLLRRSRGK